MCNFVARRLAPIVAVVLVASVPAVATTVMQMNLVEMVQRSAQIYRGTVLSATEGTVKAGGGQLPVVTYRLQVEESFRGDIPVVKGMRIAEIQMIGKSSPVRKGTLVRASVLPQMPALAIGRTYVVFTTAAERHRPVCHRRTWPGGLPHRPCRQAGGRRQRSEQQRSVPRHGRSVIARGPVACGTGRLVRRLGKQAPSRTSSWPTRSATPLAGFRRR